MSLYRLARQVAIYLTTAVFLVSCGGSPTSGQAPDPDRGAPSTTHAVISSSSTAPDDETTTTTGADVSGSENDRLVVEAFQSWVEALAEGEMGAAWDRMAPSSQQALGSRERFFEMRSGLAEGWGSWVAVEEPEYSVEEDDPGRSLLIVRGTIRPEGNQEYREVGVPFVVEGDRVLISPFEEFGNVAEGLEEEDSGGDQPDVPPGSGEGRRVVYSNTNQRVWLVEADGSIHDNYRVSGKIGVPKAGTYEVFSKSELASAGHDGITMRHMVRFAHGRSLAIGFHAIPNDGNGRPLQSEEELGEYRSAGCVRQSPGHAAALYEWAPVGTKVVVLP